MTETVGRPRTFGLLAAVVACLCAGRGAWGEAGSALLLAEGPVTAWSCHSCVKVFPSDPPPQERAESAGVWAARGETEAVQIVLRPRAALAGVAASAEDFEGPHRLPSSIASVRWVAYVSVRQASGPGGGTGMYPDPLPSQPPAQIPANQNQAAWVTVRVPADAQPGDYRTTVAFTANGAVLCKVPLSLHVWAFELPPTTLKVQAGIRSGAVLQWEPGGSPEEALARYVRDMADHGVNAFSPMLVNPGQGWAQHDAEIAFLRSVGIQYFPMPLGWVEHDRQHRWLEDAAWRMQNPLAAMGVLAPTSPRALTIADASGSNFDARFRDTLTDITQRFTQHYQELGILDRSWVQFIDEPDLTDERTVAWVAGISKILKDASPSLRIRHTRAPVPELLRYTDIWMVHADMWAPLGANIEQARQDGDEIWVYHNTIPLIDHTPMRVRTFGWAIWAHKVQGVGAWWNLTAWDGNPWEDPINGPRAGDGMLLYPPQHADEQGPIDSIRWEVWRDSLQDHRLLELAAATAEAHPENADLRQLLSEAESVCPTWPGVRDTSSEPYWTDPMKLEDLRRRIAKAVGELSS